ncbi:MAG: response regulator [Terriglobales bacterium]|jgi:CheY-like chemotaxis protein
MKCTPTEVLLVDDNPADRELTSEFLSRSHYPSHIHTAGDGDEAIAFLQGAGKYAHVARPDLIVLDLNLPRKPGHAVLSAVKQSAGLQRVPVVIFSTSQAPADILGSYQLGANSYVCKPGNLPDFAAAVTTMGDFWFGCAGRHCSPEASVAENVAIIPIEENA